MATEIQINEASLEEIAKQVGDLPPLPAAALEAMRRLDDPNVTAERLQEAIARDQALAAQVLRIANSAMFCFQRKVSSLSHAVAILGFNALRSILIAASVQKVFYAGPGSRGTAALRPLWKHAWGAAVAARAIAQRTGYGNADEAFTSGLVHDLGKLVLLRNDPHAYGEIISSVELGGGNFYDLEMRVFGFSHAHVGALLALKWLFPAQLVAGILHHHDDDPAPEYAKLTSITHLANRMMVFLGVGFEKDGTIRLADETSAQSLDLDAAQLEDLTAAARKMIASVPSDRRP